MENKEKMMDSQVCMYCGGQLEEQHVTRFQKYKDKWVLIENVPALVCSQCGEQFFTPTAHDLVVDLISGTSKPVRTETVAVYDAELAK